MNRIKDHRLAGRLLEDEVARLLVKYQGSGLGASGRPLVLNAEYTGRR